jgi:hypothetical protein
MVGEETESQSKSVSFNCHFRVPRLQMLFLIVGMKPPLKGSQPIILISGAGNIFKCTISSIVELSCFSIPLTLPRMITKLDEENYSVKNLSRERKHNYISRLDCFDAKAESTADAKQVLYFFLIRNSW